MKIKFDIKSFGITYRSLKVLRDTLATSIGDEIAIAQVPTDDICCGFLIVNKTTGEATFTGDGFRTDGGGEGGAGYKSAQALLRLFGLSFFDVYPMEPVNSEEICRGNIEGIKKIFLDMADDLERIADYRCPVKLKPQYLRSY
ncbi:MAG: hypothetical protein JXB42_10395 [Deltaproteobacteria bacterium]|nr:hypothetical protein [Deltaproteobacteria bacterium]